MKAPLLRLFHSQDSGYVCEHGCLCSITSVSRVIPQAPLAKKHGCCVGGLVWPHVRTGRLEAQVCTGSDFE